jgi:hypothetical protein
MSKPIDIDWLFDQIYKLKRERTEQEKREAAEWRGPTVDPILLVKHGIPFCFGPGGGYVMASSESWKRAEELGLVHAPAERVAEVGAAPAPVLVGSAGLGRERDVTPAPRLDAANDRPAAAP